jgi:ribonuclease III
VAAGVKPRDITALEATLGYHFLRPELLQQALTHSSHAREMEAGQGAGSVDFRDNEQMEFLGDAVLSLVTSEDLFHAYPKFSEGQLSKLRAHLVSERHLVRVARRLEIGSYLQLGRGEEKSGGRAKTALLVDALEAILAAMYLDGGLESARQFIRQVILLPELKHLNLQESGVLPVTDYKSALQEALQASGRLQPSYVMVKEEGPEHSKTFTVEARLHGQNRTRVEFVGRAQGTTKKSAEQEAARQVLDYLNTIVLPARTQDA